MVTLWLPGPHPASLCLPACLPVSRSPARVLSGAWSGRATSARRARTAWGHVVMQRGLSHGTGAQRRPCAAATGGLARPAIAKVARGRGGLREVYDEHGMAGHASVVQPRHLVEVVQVVREPRQDPADGELRLHLRPEVATRAPESGVRRWLRPWSCARGEREQSKDWRASRKQASCVWSPGVRTSPREGGAEAAGT